MNKGYSLLEVIIYVAIFAFLSVGAVDFIGDAYGVMAKVSLQRKVNAEGELVMQRLLRETREAYDVRTASTTWNAHPGKLSLYTFLNPTGTATTTADFYISSGVLRLTKGTSTIDITSDDISVSNLIFRSIQSATTSRAVKIELQITGSTRATTITNNFYGTALLRGSY
jgi:type II secretory pathway pseudopilin PulG